MIPNDGTAVPGTVEPVWQAGKLSGVSASLAGLTRIYSLAVLAHDALEMMVSEGLIRNESGAQAQLRWQVEVGNRQEAAGGPKLRCRVKRAPYPIENWPLSRLGISGSGPNGGPLRVYVSSALVEELRQETANSLHTERADVLTGRLCREAEDVLALVLRRRIPLVEGTTASASHVSFSPRTFQAAEQERLRRGEDHICAWHHNHPPSCGRECLMIVPPCHTDTVFLSVADHSVFRASFPAAYMVGLVSGKGAERRADDPIVHAYGWRDGVVTEIQYTVYGE